MSKKPGLSLLDLGKLQETVMLGDQEITVTGINMKDIFALLQRFPTLMQVFQGSMVEAMKSAPDAIAAVITAATDEVNNLEAEAVAAALPIETQLDILEAVGRLTFRNGFGPFVNRLVEMANAVSGAVLGGSGRATATNLPPPSKPSSPPATDNATSGS